MAFQDDLLTFQIRETIFLSSDKAGIAELKELELLPDVEVIENPAEISITGCLHLHGKYEPAGSSQAGGTDTLVSTLHFSPFQLKENETSDFPFYPIEQDLTHRIPVNITIPVHRVADIGSIYAIVDSFDYQLNSARQLQVEAELKLAGIQLKPQETAQQTHEREWEFVHVANQEPEHEIEPASLDEIERKLAALEQEIEQREEQQRQEQARFTFPSAPYPSPAFQSPVYPSPYFTNDDDSPEAPVEADAPYIFNHDESPAEPVEADAPYIFNHDESPAEPVSMEEETETAKYDNEQADSPTFFGDVTFAQQNTVIRPPATFPFRPISTSKPEEDGKTEEVAAPKVAEANAVEAVAQEELSEASAEPLANQHQATAEPEAVDSAAEQEAAAEPEAVDAAAEQEATEDIVNEPEAETQEGQELDEAEEVMAALEASETAESTPEQPAAEPKEMKVAISGKPATEPEAAVNLTSIFSHARRAQAKQAAEETESPASASNARKGATPEVDRKSLQAVESLTSFVRNNDERFSKLRLCIIQRNENLETIASRYSLPISRILELNNLSSDQVVEGQILYIPY